MKVVIVGGVAGGASAAARLRRMDENAEIILLERSGYVSYANCGLPYYIGGTIEDRAKLTLHTPESLHSRFDIDVRVATEATSIDRAAKQVSVRNLETGEEYTESYDYLILSPGAKAVLPDIAGVEADRLFTLRTVEDTYAIADFVRSARPKTAAVIGGGFIGVEMADNLVDWGLQVALYQRPKHVLPILDDDMACFVHNHMREHGVDLYLGASVEGLIDEGEALTVQSNVGERTFDMVIMSIGVVPESTLAADAGLDLGVKGAIVVDEYMCTSDPAIYAVGDAVQVKNFVTSEEAHIPLAGPANKQGRIAADNIAGKQARFTGSLGSSVLKVFDLTVAATGLNETSAKNAGVAYDCLRLSPSSHATYYPDSSPVRMKVLFDPETGRILGGQAVSGEGAEKRIDVIVTAIHGHMTARDLSELDLCYAPPYSSAKDPVNMAGFAICNLLDGLVEQVSWEEALNRPEDTVLIDAREPWEIEKRGSAPGAAFFELDKLREHLDELPRDKRLYLYCQTGVRSYVACRILKQHGFDCVNISGGHAFYAAWEADQEASQPI